MLVGLGGRLEASALCEAPGGPEGVGNDHVLRTRVHLSRDEECRWHDDTDPRCRSRLCWKHLDAGIVGGRVGRSLRDPRFEISLLRGTCRVGVNLGMRACSASRCRSRTVRTPRPAGE